MWDFAGTPGLATDFLSSAGITGKHARELFQTGMKQLRRKELEGRLSGPVSLPEGADLLCCVETAQDRQTNYIPFVFGFWRTQFLSLQWQDDLLKSEWCYGLCNNGCDFCHPNSKNGWRIITKGPVTRCNFSCNLQRNFTFGRCKNGNRCFYHSLLICSKHIKHSSLIYIS